MKLRIGLIYGGESPEHDVSISSHNNLLSHINKERYEPISIYVDREGANWPKVIATLKDHIDVAFPLFHGPKGEDGAIAALCELLNIPYVGFSSKSAALAMDKEWTKRWLAAKGLPVVPSVTLDRQNIPTFDAARRRLGSSLFIKPAHLGSSWGVRHIHTETEWTKALDEVFELDQKLIVERAINGREIECAILNDEVALPGEIIPPKGRFYDHALKCTDEEVLMRYAVPAQLTVEQVSTVQRLALATHRAIEGRGLSRIDFFLTHEGEWFINEINPLPGLTKTSLYPKMWAASGLPFSELIDELIKKVGQAPSFQHVL